jgi:hypothetical protein
LSKSLIYPCKVFEICRFILVNSPSPLPITFLFFVCKVSLNGPMARTQHIIAGHFGERKLHIKWNYANVNLVYARVHIRFCAAFTLVILEGSSVPL